MDTLSVDIISCSVVESILRIQITDITKKMKERSEGVCVVYKPYTHGCIGNLKPLMESERWIENDCPERVLVTFSLCVRYDSSCFVSIIGKDFCQRQKIF